MNPAELMVTAGDVPILKSFFYARQSTGSGLPTSTGMAKGVSNFANAMQLTKHILKSAWCMCLSPRIKPYRLHCAQRSVSASTPPPEMALFLHMTLKWFADLIKLDHVHVTWDFQHYFQATFKFFLCCFSLCWPLSQLEQDICSIKLQKNVILESSNCHAKTASADITTA